MKEKQSSASERNKKNASVSSTKAIVMLRWYDVEELAAYLLGLGDDYTSYDIENILFDKYEISFEAFHEIIEKLLPLVDVGESPITKKLYRGFSRPVNEKARAWLLKIDAA